jgi:hypothetical protein
VTGATTGLRGRSTKQLNLALEMTPHGPWPCRRSCQRNHRQAHHRTCQGRRAASRCVVRRRIEDFTLAFVRRLTRGSSKRPGSAALRRPRKPRSRPSQCVPASRLRSDGTGIAGASVVGGITVNSASRPCLRRRTYASFRARAAGDGCRSARWCAVIKQTLEVLDILRARHAADPL